MKISVVVPSYNHRAYLAQRIDSILAQTLDDFELLLLDDASTDDSRDILMSYAGDPRVRIAFNEKNSGSAYAQWQKGLGLSTGEYIWIAQSDDFAEPDFLARLVAALDSDPAIGMAVADSRVVDQAGAFLHYDHTNWSFKAAEADAPGSSLFDVIDGRAYNAAYMHPWNSIPNVSATVIRRTAFDAIGGPVLDMPLCGDWMSYARMLMGCGIARVPEALNSFRSHDRTIRSRTRGSAFVRQAIAVQRYVERELDLPPATADHAVRQFFAQAILASERRLPSGKVPAGRAAAVLREAAGFGAPMAASVGGILLREGLAALICGRLR